MSRPSVSVLSLVAALAALSFAGCIGAPDPVPPPGDEALATGSTGSIRGVVGSDAFEPIEGASVTLVETVRSESPLEAHSAADGSFVINGIPPGRYTVWATAPGYDAARVPVEVQAGVVSDLRLLLDILPCAACPYEDLREYVGIIRLGVSWQVEVPGTGCVIEDTPVWTVKTCSGVRFGNSEDNGEIAINVSAGAGTLFAALVWQSAGALGERLSFDLMCADTPRNPDNGAVLDTQHPCYHETPATTSPIVHRVDRADWEEKGYDPAGDWAARVFGTYGMLGTYGPTGTDIGAAYEQKFEIFTEVWVNHEAPQGHSPIPDA